MSRLSAVCVCVLIKTVYKFLQVGIVPVGWVNQHNSCGITYTHTRRQKFMGYRNARKQRLYSSRYPRRVAVIDLHYNISTRSREHHYKISKIRFL